jgi:hypothetical protein
MVSISVACFVSLNKTNQKEKEEYKIRVTNRKMADLLKRS